MQGRQAGFKVGQCAPQRGAAARPLRLQAYTREAYTSARVQTQSRVT